VSTAAPFARAVLGAALAILLGMGLSLLLARFRLHAVMRWPAALVIALGVGVAVYLGVRG
jgi:hypothetical protein